MSLPATLVAAIYIVFSAVILSMHFWLMPTVYGVGGVITLVSLARILTYMSGDG